MGKMTAFEWVLAIGMLITGSINTITTKYADTSYAIDTYGNCVPFSHPFVQTGFMFGGEFLCLFVSFWAVYRLTKAKTEVMSYKYGPIFALPACCDFTATSLMYIALILTYASTYQMLRGCVVIFTGIASVLFLKRKFYAYNWIALVMVLLGTILVGVASILEGSTTNAPNPVLGDILIIVAQIVVAVQMVLEEKLISKFKTHPLQVVGCEGTAGLCITTIALIIMFHCKGNKTFNTLTPIVNCVTQDTSQSLPDIIQPKFEDASDAFLMMNHNRVILGFMMGSLMSIAFFNYFGVSVTSNMSATHRMVIDSTRTVIIWVFELATRTEVYHPLLFLELTGFLILLLGTIMYNEIIHFPFLYYPKKENPQLLSVAINSAKSDDVRDPLIKKSSTIGDKKNPV